MVHQGLFPPPFFLLTYDLKAPRPPTKEEESTEHLNHWQESHRIQFSIIV